jgi:hypothetical protein
VNFGELVRQGHVLLSCTGPKQHALIIKRPGTLVKRVPADFLDLLAASVGGVP